MIDLINYYKIPLIDFLACNTLNNIEWTNYYNELPYIVGASNNYTGNLQYGGDWNMESTGENIELIYFTSEIEYYKYLLNTIVTKYTFGYTSNGCGLAVMNRTTTNKIIITSCDKNRIFFYDFSPLISTTTSNTEWYNIYIASSIAGPPGPGAGGMVVYKSSFSCPSAFQSYEYLIYTQLSTTNIGLIYNINITPGQTYTVNSTFIKNDTWVNNILIPFQRYNGICLFNNNTLYYTCGSIVGKATIIDSLSSGQVPTCSNNVTHLTSANLTYTLSSLTSYYPTGITCDTNGYLYIVMGNTTTPVGNKIQVFNGTNYNKTIDLSITYPSIFPLTLEYYSSLAWNNYTLYIGTYIGTYDNSKTGRIFAYNTTDDTAIIYQSNYKSSTALVIDATYLLSLSLTATSGTSLSVDIMTPLMTHLPIPNDSGFFSNSIDICGNFTPVTQFPPTDLTLPTTSYVSGGLKTGFYKKINGTYYDLSTLYKVQSTEIAIAAQSTDLNMYTIINNIPYSLSRIFIKNA